MADESRHAAWVKSRIEQATAILNANGAGATEASVEATTDFIMESDEAYARELGVPAPPSLFHTLLCAVMMAAEESAHAQD